MLPLLIPAITAGIGAIGGALNNTKAARTTTTTPTFAPEYKTIQDLLRARAEDSLRSRFDMSGIAANGISGINDVFQGINQSSANNLTARGLASSPVAGAVGANLDMARGGQIAQFLNNLPLLQSQLETQGTNNALNVLNLGRGTTSVGPGSVAGGAFSSAAELLAFMKGQGAF